MKLFAAYKYMNNTNFVNTSAFYDMFAIYESNKNE